MSAKRPFRRNDGQPFLIAGPCSAESREQMLAAVRPLKGVKSLSAIRAGVWKPRTRPDSFEGIGVQALPWLVEAGAELDLPVCTEVAKPEHVEACLKAGITMLWIGARTTVNPFYVQEIAEAMRGTDVQVLVKNPIHPEIGLWMGALERFHKAGISELGAIHRGYFSLNAHPYRNAAGWELAIALKEQWPELSVLCDPSHIAGDRSYVAELAQIGLELGLDGLMIEVHPDPKHALSDAEQQMDPEQLIEAIDQLKMHRQVHQPEEIPERIRNERALIDGIDADLMKLFGKRLEHVANIAREKEKEGLAFFQWSRWKEVLKTRGEHAEESGIDQRQVEELFRIIHKHSVGKQVQEVRKKEGGKESGA